MASSRRILHVAAAVLLGAALALGTHANVARAEYAEVACATLARPDAPAQARPPARSAATAPSPRWSKASNVFAPPRRAERPTVRRTTVIRRLYLTSHALLI
jgi:hypothetical protein